MSLQDQARSISQKLSKMAREENTTFQNIATEFLIERLLVRITSDKKLFDSLVFKGGYVGLRVYDSPRYTIDLDALLIKSDIQLTLNRIKSAAETDSNDGVWFRFEKEVDLKTQGEYGGIRLEFRTGIGEILKDVKRAQIIQVDIGIGDPVLPITLETEELLGKEKISWKVYPIETMIAEKIHAWVDRGPDNSRSKDIFDLYQFLPKANSAELKKALKACFEYRKTELPKDLFSFLSALDLALIKRGWANAVAGIKLDFTFEEIYSSVLDQIKLKVR
jgi:predicted nucleotidyltransferase component of viral defense system